LFSGNTDQIIVYRTRLGVADASQWGGGEGGATKAACPQYLFSYEWQTLFLSVILVQCVATHLTGERTLNSVLS